MRNPKGYAQILDPDAPTFERDTTSCAHCNGVIFVKPGTACTTYQIQRPDLTWIDEPGAACYRCGMRPICLPCHDLGICVPFERKLDEAEGTLRKGRLIF
jgi:hypothetical protein